MHIFKSKQFNIYLLIHVMTTQNGLIYFGFQVNSVMFYSMIYLTDNDVYSVLLNLIVEKTINVEKL